MSLAKSGAFFLCIYGLVLCAFLSTSSMAGISYITINTHGSQFMQEGQHATPIVIDVHIVRRAENRQLVMVWNDEDGEVGRSEISLDGANTPSLYQRKLLLAAGEYIIKAWVQATDRMSDATAMITVTGGF